MYYLNIFLPKCCPSRYVLKIYLTIKPLNFGLWYHLSVFRLSLLVSSNINLTTVINELSIWLFYFIKILYALLKFHWFSIVKPR